MAIGMGATFDIYAMDWNQIVGSHATWHVQGDVSIVECSDIDPFESPGWNLFVVNDVVSGRTIALRVELERVAT